MPISASLSLVSQCRVLFAVSVVDSSGDDCLDITVKNTENIRTCLLQGQENHNLSQKMSREIPSGLWRLLFTVYSFQVNDVVEIQPGPGARLSTAWTEWLGFSPEDTLTRSGLVLGLASLVPWDVGRCRWYNVKTMNQGCSCQYPGCLKKFPEDDDGIRQGKKEFRLLLWFIITETNVIWWLQRTEENDDNLQWEPGDQEATAASQRYVGPWRRIRSWWWWYWSRR